MRPKVFVVDSDVLITRMFMNNDWLVVNSEKEADLIQFTGGHDVSPMLYGEVKHPSTSCWPDRDQRESDVFHRNFEKPKAGICRGGQFLNVMSGGSMWQHVNNHSIGGTHLATHVDGREFQVTSTHHQMIIPDYLRSDTILTATLATSKEDGNQYDHGNEPDIDTEAVWYDDTTSLCFQPHPEYVDIHHECQELYFELLNEYFGLKS